MYYLWPGIDDIHEVGVFAGVGLEYTMKHLFVLYTASSEPRERLTAATNGRLKQGPCVSIKLKKGNAHNKNKNVINK